MSSRSTTGNHSTMGR